MGSKTRRMVAAVVGGELEVEGGGVVGGLLGVARR